MIDSALALLQLSIVFKEYQEFMLKNILRESLLGYIILLLNSPHNQARLLNLQACVWPIQIGEANYLPFLPPLVRQEVKESSEYNRHF